MTLFKSSVTRQSAIERLILERIWLASLTLLCSLRMSVLTLNKDHFQGIRTLSNNLALPTITSIPVTNLGSPLRAPADVGFVRSFHVVEVHITPIRHTQDPPLSRLLFRFPLRCNLPLRMLAQVNNPNPMASIQRLTHRTLSLPVSTVCGLVTLSTHAVNSNETTQAYTVVCFHHNKAMSLKVLFLPQ